MNCLSKTGSSSKPHPMTSLFLSIRNNAYTPKICCWCGYAALLLSCLVSYYLYLDHLYIVDEVLDVNGPRELSLSEKITIRTIAPSRLSDLNNFVLTYSVCPVVYEIQVVWNQPLPYPLASSFKYAHTHSKVLFNSSPLQFEVATESVLLLDVDVVVSCADLLFTQTVWRSSRDALVGFFPRLHEDDRLVQQMSKSKGVVQNTQLAPQYNFLGLRHVLWTSSYSLLLSGGVMVKKEYLQSFEKSSVVTSLMNSHSQCYDLAVSVYSAHLKAPAPIFVDIPVAILSGVKLSPYHLDAPAGSSSTSETKQSSSSRMLSKTNSKTTSLTTTNTYVRSTLTDLQRSKCLTLLMSQLGVTYLPVAHSKSAVAKHQWVW